MDMRVERMQLQAERPCGPCRTQMTVEGEVTLPGSLRDAVHVLRAAATAVVERTETLQDRLSASGRVVFWVLYTQGDARQISSIEATADFTHLCELPGAGPKAEGFARAQVEKVTADVQNGRMTLRARVGLTAGAWAAEAAELVAAIPGDVRQRTRQLSLRRTVGRGAREVLLREEFSLPGDLMIRDTLGAQASAVYFDAAGGAGRIGLSGEVTIEAIHTSDMPGRPLVVTRHTVPVSQSVEIAGEGGDLLEGHITVKDVAAASQDAGSGDRVLRAEVLLGLEAWADKEEEATLLSDAYTLSGEALQLRHGALTVRRGGRYLRAAESGKSTLLLPEGAPPLRTVLAAGASPVLVTCRQQGNRLLAEGTLDTTLLYTSDAGDTAQSVNVEAPFRVSFALQGAQLDNAAVTAVNVEALPVTSDRAELRYVLQLEAEGAQADTVDAVTDAAFVAAPPATKDVVLYFAQPGESLWEIAKRYRVSEEDLRLLNPGLSGEPKAGQGLVVWHRSAV